MIVVALDDAWTLIEWNKFSILFNEKQRTANLLTTVTRQCGDDRRKVTSSLSLAARLTIARFTQHVRRIHNLICVNHIIHPSDSIRGKKITTQIHSEIRLINWNWNWKLMSEDRRFIDVVAVQSSTYLRWVKNIIRDDHNVRSYVVR